MVFVAFLIIRIELPQPNVLKPSALTNREITKVILGSKKGSSKREKRSLNGWSQKFNALGLLDPFLFLRRTIFPILAP